MSRAYDAGFFLTAPVSSLQEVVILCTDMVREATAEVLKMHSIPAMVSKDLQDVLGTESEWLAGKAQHGAPEAAPEASPEAAPEMKSVVAPEP